MKRERITIDLEVGTLPRVWERALGIARSFATEYIDKPAGFAVAYHLVGDVPPGITLWVHWTKARAVVVRQRRSGEVTPVVAAVRRA